jgi:hypothetical protein
MLEKAFYTSVLVSDQDKALDLHRPEERRCESIPCSSPRRAETHQAPPAAR